MERLHLPMATDSRTVAAALTFELVGSENMHESNPHVFVVGSGAELKIADQDRPNGSTNVLPSKKILCANARMSATAKRYHPKSLVG